ncbi:MAG TPA: response regulator [Candidatus Kapabacteria bacterium]|nr:response regulator [Candidatus Kapabacteria bacterium]HPO61884.1 response regulator [Candidatus Kapabacteria bacterium]
MNDNVTSGFNPTVLIVDDSMLSRKLIAELLNGEDFRIIFGKSGKDAIEIISDIQVDCLLLDLLIPDIDGFQVLEYIQKNSLDVPSIIISADIQETTRKRVESLGAYGFLNKPPKREDLVKAVKDSISKKFGG